jgi:hypothetical protein
MAGSVSKTALVIIRLQPDTQQEEMDYVLKKCFAIARTHHARIVVDEDRREYGWSVRSHRAISLLRELVRFRAIRQVKILKQ